MAEELGYLSKTVPCGRLLLRLGQDREAKMAMVIIRAFEEGETPGIGCRAPCV